MTNKERLISLLGFKPDKNSIDGILLEKGVEGLDEFDPDGEPDVVKSIKLCAISLMELLITTPDQTNDVGMVIRYDRPSLLARLNSLKIEAGVTTTGPRLRNKSYLW